MKAHDKILLTAQDLFYREGIRATGVDRIIAAAQVTKVTFYRHFSSKNALIQAYLHYRHEQWMTWFKTTLAYYLPEYADKPIMALIPTLQAWFESDQFRGCAFINAVVEVATIPEVMTIAQTHKAEMTKMISLLLPEKANTAAQAVAIATLIDGAIIKAQIDQADDRALQALVVLLEQCAN
jgi:AcrR family transcriptional regulator